MNTRRHFIKKTAIDGAGISLLPNLTFGVEKSLDKLKIGMRGVGLRVTNHLNNVISTTWSAITPLSELSIENNGEPQDFPDFTKGNWIKKKPYNWMKDSF